MVVVADITGRDSVCGPGFHLSGRTCVRDGWLGWGRWIVTGVILVAALLFGLAALFIIRRRRRRAARPMGGSTWLGGGSKLHGQAPPPPPPPPPPPQTYPYADPNQPYYGGYGAPPYEQYGAPPPPPPPAGSHATGDPFSPNDGYYGGQQYGVQQPASAYQPAPQGYPSK